MYGSLGFSILFYFCILKTISKSFVQNNPIAPAGWKFRIVLNDHITAFHRQDPLAWMILLITLMCSTYFRGIFIFQGKSHVKQNIFSMYGMLQYMEKISIQNGCWSKNNWQWNKRKAIVRGQENFCLGSHQLSILHFVFCLQPGEFKNDPYNNCTIYSCVNIHNQLISSTSEITCPAFNEESCKPVSK